MEEPPGGLQEADEAGDRHALDHCACAVEEDAAAQRQLLDRGLEITSKWGSSGGLAGAGSERFWAQQRLRLLQRSERLETLQELQRGGYAADAYRSLCEAGLSEVATCLARAGHVDAVVLLLRRHPYVLAPAILDVADALPETLEARAYVPLLRAVAALGADAPALPRALDWAETQQAVEELRQEGEFALVLGTEPLAKLALGWAPPTARQRVQWLLRRALAVDAVTGQLSTAAALLGVCGAALGAADDPAVAALLSSAAELSVLVELETGRGGDAWRMPLERYSGLAPGERLAALAAALGPGDLEEDIEEVLVPLLERSFEPGQRAEALTQLLERETPVRLSWVLRFVQQEGERLAAFRSAADLADATCAAVYACRATDAWAALESMLGCAEEAVERDGGLTGQQAEAAAATLRATQRRVTAARLLTKHGLATPVKEVLDSNRTAAERLVRTLLARVARSKNTESRWVEVWMDLRAVVEQGLTALSEADIRTELCRALLRCGQFRLAQSYLEGLEPGTAELVVVAAGRDYFLSADTLDAPEVAQAQACLELLPGSDAARHELRAITAARQLRGLGIDVPPAQLRQGGGGQEMLSKILESHPEVLSDVGTLLQLMELLGCEAEERPGALIQAALTALEAGDVGQAEGLALQLAKQGHGAAWEVASQVADSELCSSVESKAILLSFAMRHADPAQLAQLLHSWQSADAVLSGVEAWADPDPDRAGPSLLQPLSDGMTAYFREAAAQRRSPGALSAAPLALSCLLASGPEGAEQWDELLEEHRARLSQGAALQALALPATAFALLALEPSSLPLEQLEERATEARQRMAASPRDLLAQACARDLPSDAAKAAPGLGRSASAVSTAGDSRASTTSAADTEPGADTGQTADSGAGPSAAASAALAESYRRRLVASADEHRVSQLLPGVDAARLTSRSDPAAQRQVVLQLAAAAGRPAGRGAAAQAEPTSREGWLQSPKEEGEEAAPAGRKGGKKKREAAEAAVPGGILSASRAAGLLAEALSLGARYEVPAWEVQLQYVESLLAHNQGQLEAVREAVHDVWDELLEGHAEAALGTLAGPVYAATSSAAGEHLCYCIDLMRQCCDRLASGEEPSSADVPWPALAMALLGIGASASGLLACAPGADVKAFVAPLMRELAAWIDGSSLDAASPVSSVEPVAALRDQVLEFVDDDNAQQMADCLEGLAQAHAALVAAHPPGERPAGDHGFDLGSTTPFMGLLLKLLPSIPADGGEELQQCQDLMQQLGADEVVAAASFAALGGPSPWVPGDASSAVDLSETAQVGLLGAALAALESSPPTEEAAQHQAAVLKQRHSQLVALADVREHCSLSIQQLQLVRPTVEQLPPLDAPAAAEASAALVDRCLQDLLTDGCAVLSVLHVATVCLRLAGLLGSGDAVAESVQAAARAAVTSALQAMAGLEQTREPPLSAGDAVQHLFGILRAANAAVPAEDMEGSTALDCIRTLVWGLLQQTATAYDASGDAAATEAHVQVLELLGTLGSSMWRGWAVPAEGAAAAGFSHQQALLFTRTAAALAFSWPAAVQEANVTAASFGDAEAAEAAVLRLVECAEGDADRLEGVALVLREVLADAFEPAEGDAALALHRCWAGCLRALLDAGRLTSVLQALDHYSVATPEPALPLLTQHEVEGLLEAADASHGAAAAAAMAALTPYRQLQRARWDVLFAACDGGALPSDIAALPGISAALTLLILQRQLPGITSSRLPLFQKLGASLLLFDGPAAAADCGAGLTVRNALAVTAVAQLASHQLYSAAAWLGMRCIGTHPLLRVLDSANRSLLSLLGPCSKRAAIAALPSGVAEKLEVPRTLEAILQAFPEQCAAGLAQLTADLS